MKKKYFSEDYSRAALEDMGGYSYAPKMNQSYIDKILTSLDREKIKRSCFKLVLDYEYDNLLELLPVFLKQLNCQIISTRNFSFNNLPIAYQERLKLNQKVGRIIRDNMLDFGLIVGHNAERINLVDEQGNTLNQPELQVLISYILLDKGIDKLYLPLNAPRVIERLAKSYKAEIEYTPIRPQFVMNKYLKNRADYNFYPFRDAIFSLGLVLEKLAKDGITYRQLINKLPEFYLEQDKVPCERADKGRVMRYLSGESQKQTELIDGIKFDHENGWALVVPDSEAAWFNIFAEAEDAETAQSLTGIYRERLKKLIER